MERKSHNILNLLQARFFLAVIWDNDLIVYTFAKYDKIISFHIFILKTKLIC